LQWTAKIVLNAADGENEHDRSKIAQVTTPEIQSESFGAIKCPKKIFSSKISPEMNRKITGNDIF